MRLPQTLAMVILALSFALGCAEKPKKVHKTDAGQSLYSKDKFRGAASFASSKGQARVFLEAARDAVTEESKPAFDALGIAFGDMNEFDFVVTRSYLTLVYPSQENFPVAQWSIEKHCYEKEERNDRGEKTRFLEYDCSSDHSWQKLPLFKADPTSVIVRHFDGQQYNMLPVESFESVDTPVSKRFLAASGYSGDAPVKFVMTAYSIDLCADSDENGVFCESSSGRTNVKKSF